MRLASESPQPTSDASAVIGVPLSVIFAEGEAIEKVRKSGATTLKLEAPFHLSDSDAYLVLPDDIGMEIVDIMQDHDLDLLHEAMRDGLIVDGSVDDGGDGDRVLDVRQSWTPRTLLKADPTYAAQIAIGMGGDPLDEINALPHLNITVVSRLFDDEGLDRSMRKRESVGVTWRAAPLDALGPSAVDPTYAWTKRITDGRVGVEFALFKEYEELVALLRPLELRFRL